MNKILIFTVLLVLGIIVYDQQSRTTGVAAALYSTGDVIKISSGASAIALEAYNSQEYRDLSPIAAASGKGTITRDPVNNSNITSSVYTNVFKLAHKTVSGWMNSGSSAVKVNNETTSSLPAPLYAPIILPTSG